LHPDGEVKNLRDAMDGRFDVFYGEKQRKVSFGECALGQLLEVEGPLEPVSWRSEWDEWSYAT
jgi:N-acetylglucosamine-6-sulfatase